ncbi:MAG: hypothetical protein HYS98_00145 [Deltaproteobacteria bacterium]|nr:hypothetical protein [Deltaproteobacteria bacterium]
MKLKVLFLFAVLSMSLLFVGCSEELGKDAAQDTISKQIVELKPSSGEVIYTAAVGKDGYSLNKDVVSSSDKVVVSSTSVLTKEDLVAIEEKYALDTSKIDVSGLSKEDVLLLEKDISGDVVATSYDLTKDGDVDALNKEITSDTSFIVADKTSISDPFTAKIEEFENIKKEAFESSIPFAFEKLTSTLMGLSFDPKASLSIKTGENAFALMMNFYMDVDRDVYLYIPEEAVVALINTGYSSIEKLSLAKRVTIYIQNSTTLFSGMVKEDSTSININTSGNIELYLDKSSAVLNNVKGSELNIAATGGSTFALRDSSNVQATSVLSGGSTFVGENLSNMNLSINGDSGANISVHDSSDAKVGIYTLGDIDAQLSPGTSLWFMDASYLNWLMQ